MMLLVFLTGIIGSALPAFPSCSCDVGTFDAFIPTEAPLPGRDLGHSVFDGPPCSTDDNLDTSPLHECAYVRPAQENQPQCFHCDDDDPLMPQCVHFDSSLFRAECFVQSAFVGGKGLHATASVASSTDQVEVPIVTGIDSLSDINMAAPGHLHDAQPTPSSLVRGTGGTASFTS
jgi:hypothetical protein